MVEFFNSITEINDVRIWFCFIGILVLCIETLKYFLKQKENKLVHFFTIVPVILGIISGIISLLCMIRAISVIYMLISMIIFCCAMFLGVISCWLKIKKYNYIFMKTEKDYKKIKKTAWILFLCGLYFVILFIFIYFI